MARNAGEKSPLLSISAARFRPPGEVARPTRCGTVTQRSNCARSWAAAALILAALPAVGLAQDVDYQVYTESPRLLLNQRRLRLLKRERERESLRWQQFDSLMRGKARMAETGFALALWGTVTAKIEPCRDAGLWSLKTADAANPRDLRQMALVYDWCQSSMDESAASMLGRKLAAVLKNRPAEAAAVRSHVFAALAVADVEPQGAQDLLKYAVEMWWKGKIMPQLRAGQNPFLKREDLYAMMEFLHAVRDNTRADIREGAGKWFEELAPLQMLSYYPQPWPAAENEYRIPAYLGKGDPDLREAAYSRAAEMAMVAYDGNAQPHQFLQGWILQDRFLMRGDFGIPYEFLWANPYQPGLSFTYMPDLFHARGQLLTRSSWDEDATWFGFWNGQAQVFEKGQRSTVRLDGHPGPVTLGPVKVFFASAGLKMESGWMPTAEEGTKPVDQVAFLVGLEPSAFYDVEIDGQEMFEAQADSGGILELKFPPEEKVGVRVHRVM